MQVQLHCSNCQSHFASAPDTPAGEVLDRMAEGGPSIALGDGVTFEDMIFAALTSRGAIHCPSCGESVSVSETSLGDCAMQMLWCM